MNLCVSTILLILSEFSLVGFPATPLLKARARFCVAASHTKEDIDLALAEIEKVAAICHIRYRLD